MTGRTGLWLVAYGLGKTHSKRKVRMEVNPEKSTGFGQAESKGMSIEILGSQSSERLNQKQKQKLVKIETPKKSVWLE